MIILVVSLLALAKITICSDVGALQAFATSNRLFTADIYKEIIPKNNGSFVVSPLSAEIVLALTAEGACCNTKEQLVSALHLPSQSQTRSAICQLDLNISTPTAKLLSANKLYIDKNFTVKPKFKSDAVEYYKADVQTVDFANSGPTAKLINDWVAGHTNDKIQNLISPDMINGLTKLVLVNALYFNANWTYQFEKRLTYQQAFFLSSKSSKKIDMMHSNNQKFNRYCYYHSPSLQAKFLTLTYQDCNVTITFVLPDCRDGLADLEQNLGAVLEKQPCTMERVAITLPKFEINTTIDFKAALQNLGVIDLFNNNSNLCGISKLKLLVSFIIQKAFIGVNEAGTEAAAATAVGIIRELFPPAPTLEFKADHPFLYFIKDKSGVVLFVGRFVE